MQNSNKIITIWAITASILLILIVILYFVKNPEKTTDYQPNPHDTIIQTDLERIINEEIVINEKNINNEEDKIIQELISPETEDEIIDNNENDEEMRDEIITETEDEINYKYTIATLFWVGEEADSSNNYIHNKDSAWDTEWEEHFGGIDDPWDRCGYHPCQFAPQENPFYIALPYDDLIDQSIQKQSAKLIPWYNEFSHLKSAIKNQWVEIKYNDKLCYGQWEDVGPLETDDFSYVFGESEPINTFGAKAGIDLSPALRDCLEMEGNKEVGWRFVNKKEVPEGPWSQIITTRDSK